MLIQNGQRAIGSDAAFKYADYFVSMGDHEDPLKENLKGCQFKKILNYGSLRLCNALKNIDINKVKPIYDILYVSDFLLNKDREQSKIFDPSAPIENVYSAIKLLSSYAEKSDSKIAHQIRNHNPYYQEIHDLKELGLYNDKITYINPREQSVYFTCLQAEIILSASSSVIGEILRINKKAGYINLGKNEYGTYFYKDHQLIYSNDKEDKFEDFIEEIKKRKFSNIPPQNWNYVSDLITEIKNIVKGASK